MSYKAIIYWSGYSEGYGETEEEALSNAECYMPLEANTDSTETICEDGDTECHYS